ncbi:hypothetical protein U5922_007000 [Aquicoccus sp. G2-2]|jgi:hypothetical protein|uniref:hypothetical protein n=1 Tax=Aquicoccus sp. G2-2 TaxID=3092120 RepID=UPI002AE0528F|nr:hypothetical protein [Aquicoccus sp. G2-2]MEA1113235.1 hypothetical protein [Aquicoccus sp. G2-2]
MQLLIWSGAAITLFGVIGLLYVGLKVGAAKRDAGADNAALKARIEKLMPVNLAALFISVIGLMMVVIGIILA